jgi:selenocysteine lyase/cysteine desulfurase
MSHNHQTNWVVWIFYRAIPNLVHRAFEVFDHLDVDLTHFIEQIIFPKCDLVLVSWLVWHKARLT